MSEYWGLLVAIQGGPFEVKGVPLGCCSCLPPSPICNKLWGNVPWILSVRLLNIDGHLLSSLPHFRKGCASSWHAHLGHLLGPHCSPGQGRSLVPSLLLAHASADHILQPVGLPTAAVGSLRGLCHKTAAADSSTTTAQLFSLGGRQWHLCL